jgi:hypothetical protein
MRSGDVRAPGVGARAVESALRRFATVMVAAWMVVIAAAGLAEPWQPAAVLGVCLVLVGSGYAVFVSSPRTSPWSLLAPMILGSLAVARLGEVGGLVGYPMLALWLNLTTLTMGILLPMRRAAVGGVVVVAATMILTWQAHVAQAVPLGRSALFSVGAIALAVGMLVAVPAGMLRRTAQEGDSLAVAGIAAAVDSAILEGRRGELRRVQRVLHDTVMNTLGAVARFDADDRASVAERCAADLVILRRAEWAAVEDPSVVLDSVARRAHLLGVDLDVSAPDPGPALPVGVAAAVEGAAWESLNNISKHVRDRRAFLDWSWDGRSGHLRLTDAGPGVDGLSWTRGGEESIVRRCAEAGVTARIRSASGSGTVVDLVWGGGRVPPGEGSSGGPTVQAPRPREQLFAETLTRVCMVVVSVGLVATLALPGTIPRWSSLVGALGVAGLGAYSWVVQRGRAPWRVPPVVYPTLALLGTWSTGVGQEGCARVGSWWWGSLVGIVVCVAAILMDGRRPVALAAALGFLAGNALVAWGLGPGASACHPDVVVDSLVGLAGLAGLWAFRRHLSQAWALAAHQQQVLVQERARAAAAAEAVRARQAMLGFARSVAEPVMVGLAEGDLDPGDAATRARAAHAEGVLRALTAVPVADPGGAGQVLTGLVLDAHRRGLELALHLNADLDQAPELVLAGAGMLARALALCPSGSAVTITVLQSGGALQGLLLIDPRQGGPPGPASLGVPEDGPSEQHGGPGHGSGLADGLVAAGWTVTVVGDEILAEARWEDQA